MQLLHGGLQQLLGRRFDMTEIAYLRRPHFGIAGILRPLEAHELALARCLHTLADRLGGFDLAFVGQFLVIDTGDFDVDIDAVEQGTADAFLVARNG